MFRHLLLATALLGTTAAAPVHAQASCGQREEIVAVLAEKYRESHQASGLQTQSAMIEIWASPETGTWTILMTQASGVSCVVASGQSWNPYQTAALIGTPS
jgi:hypothetical protein